MNYIKMSLTFLCDKLPVLLIETIAKSNHLVIQVKMITGYIEYFVFFLFLNSHMWAFAICGIKPKS